MARRLVEWSRRVQQLAYVSLHRAPAPPASPLTALGQQIGKETLIVNRGRKARVRARQVRRRPARRVDAWSALDEGIF